MIPRRVLPLSILLVLLSTSVAAAVVEKRPIDNRIDAGSIRRVIIELPPGNVKVRTSRDATIRIDGDLAVHFGNRTSVLERRAVVAGIDMVGEKRGSRLVIGEQREGSARRGWARRLQTEHDITVTVPEGTHVELRQRNGEVDLSGSFGDLDVQMRAGEIRLSMPRSGVRDLSAKTRVGEVSADLGRQTEVREGLLPGEVRFENPEGVATVRLYVTVGSVAVRLQ
jgi:hypothetical protein